MAERYRAWCFTLNNWTEEERSAILAIKCKYMVVGKEVGGEAGVPHLQGYMQMSTVKTRAQMAKLAGLTSSHLEAAKGTPLQNFEYCSKEGDFEEVGVRPLTPEEKGAKGAQFWVDVKDAAKEGRMEDIPPKVLVSHYQQLKAIAKDNMPKQAPLDYTTGEWWVGESGTGKSRTARTTYPDAYIKGVNKWWDGYRGEKVVIIEDLDKFNVAMGGDLKRWCDHYSFPAEVKGGGMNIRPEKIIITSQYEVDEIWEDVATVQALQRRCKRRRFTKEAEPAPPAKASEVGEQANVVSAVVGGFEEYNS